MTVTTSLSRQPWVDQSLSEQLPVLRAQGEGPGLEYKVAVPDNMQDLGKEIAAFATSGAGVILIGIDDEGRLVGVPNMDSSKERDSLVKRIEGVCRGVVTPAVTPLLKFGVEEEKVVVAIDVPKGGEPVYYAHKRPYVRHLRSAQPAEPHEVIELVLSSPLARARREQAQGPPIEISHLAHVLADLLVIEPEVPYRLVNPWLDRIHFLFGQAADRLRNLAVSDAIRDLQLSGKVLDLSSMADAVSEHRHYLGRESHEEFMEKVSSAGAKALELYDIAIERPGIAEDTAPDAFTRFRENVRLLEQLATQAEERAWRNTEDVQQEASQIGERILKLTYLGLAFVDGIDVEEVRTAARELHLVETQRMYLDGGDSLRKVVATIQGAAKILNAQLASRQEAAS